MAESYAEAVDEARAVGGDLVLVERDGAPQCFTTDAHRAAVTELLAMR